MIKKFFQMREKFFHLIEHRSRNANLFCLCDQDDIWHKSNHTIERYNLMEDKELLLTHSDLSLIDEAGKLLEQSHNKLIKYQKI